MERFSLELEATEVFYGKNQSCRACRVEHACTCELRELRRYPLVSPRPICPTYRRAYMTSASEWVSPTRGATEGLEPEVSRKAPRPCHAHAVQDEARVSDWHGGGGLGLDGTTATCVSLALM